VGINALFTENGRKIPGGRRDVVGCIYSWRIKEYGLYAL
jgi:hypothetical protein